MAEDAKPDVPLSVAIMGAHNTLFDLWLKPISGALDEIAGTADKPLAQLTVTQALAWACVIGYAAATGYVISTAAINIARVAVSTPRRRFVV